MRAVHRDLKNHDASWPFREPVNPETTPHYYEAIRNPVDLKMIGARIRDKVNRNSVLRIGLCFGLC